MAYGLQLNFTGYPPIVLDTLYPAIPLGTYLRAVSGFNTRIVDTRTFTYPIAPPTGATSFANVHSVRGYIVSGGGRNTTVNYCNASRTSSVSQVECARASGLTTVLEYAITAGSDYSGSASTAAYGLFTSNNGVDSVLSGANPPLRVVARYEHVFSGVSGFIFNCPELAAMREGNNQYSFYICTQNNAHIVRAGFVSIASSGWASGARLSVGIYSRSTTQAGFVHADPPANQSGRAYILVCAPPTNTITTGSYGLTIRNSVGNVTLSPNSVPVFCRAIATQQGFGTAYIPLSDNIWGAAEALPAGAQNKTIMFPVGTEKWMELMYCRYWAGSRYSHIWGYSMKTVTGTHIIDNFVGTEIDPFGGGSATHTYDHRYTGTPTTGYLQNSQRIGLVVKEDYWL